MKEAVFQEELRLLVGEVDGSGPRDDGTDRQEKTSVFVKALL